MPSIRGAVRKKILKQSPQILQQLNSKLMDAVINKRKRKLEILRGQKRMQSRTFFPTRNTFIERKNEKAVDKMISQLASALNQKLPDSQQINLLKSMFIESQQEIDKITAGLKYAPAPRKKVFDKISKLKSDVDDIYRKQSIHKDRYVDPKDTQIYVGQLMKQYEIKEQVKDVLKSLKQVMNIDLQDVEDQPDFQAIVFSESRKGKYPKSFAYDPKFIQECIGGASDVQGHFKGHWQGDQGLKLSARLSRAKEVLAANKVQRSEQQVEQLRHGAIKLMECNV